jgi:hypothetical protein
MNDAPTAFTDPPIYLAGQAGVFTNDLAHAWRAFETLDVGGVVIDDVPTYRVDHMPYGGIKHSGVGREGLRWAIEDMTELKLMVAAQPGCGQGTRRSCPGVCISGHSVVVREGVE